jgi:hypothetical protein
MRKEKRNVNLPRKLPFSLGGVTTQDKRSPFVSGGNTTPDKNGENLPLGGLLREISLLLGVVSRPETKGPYVSVGNTTRDKRGVLYKPCRLPDRHLYVFPQIAAWHLLISIIVAASPHRDCPRRAPP